MTDNDEPTCELQVCEPNHIEVVVHEYTPPRPSICDLFDKCRHLKTDEWIAAFKLKHPECF